MPARQAIRNIIVLTTLVDKLGEEVSTIDPVRRQVVRLHEWHVSGNLILSRIDRPRKTVAWRTWLEACR